MCRMLIQYYELLDSVYILGLLGLIGLGFDFNWGLLLEFDIELLSGEYEKLLNKLPMN